MLSFSDFWPIRFLDSSKGVIDDIPQQIDNASLNDTFRLLITISWQSAAARTKDDELLGKLINCLQKYLML